MTTIAAQATRENFRDFGAPAAGAWYGRGKSAETYGIPVTIERHGRGLTVRDLSGALVDSFGDTGKFWFIPADQEAAAAEAAELQRAERDAHYAQAERERNAAQRAALAGKPAPEWATWICDETGTRIGYMSEWGVIYLPTAQLEPAPAADVEPAPAAPAQVVIVPCGAKKAAGDVRAAEKYTGPYARSARLAGEAVAQRTGALILTLSARFGLLVDDDMVPDYDLKMGDPGSVTPATIAAQAAALGITDSMVTVIAGKSYADVVSTVWPHAVRVLDGCTSYGNQRARMGAITRGEWSPAAPAAAAVPALFGADLVAPDRTVVAQAADLVRGDVLAAGTFGEQRHADPLVVTGDAVPVDQPGGRRRVHLYVHRSTGGNARHLVVWADHTVDVVDRMRELGNAPALPDVEEAEIVDGPDTLTWPRLVRADHLQAGDLVAPGGFGPWNKRDTITVTSGPRYSDTVAGVRRYDVGTRVNLPAGPGPETHGAARDDQYVPVLERRPALEAVMVAPARGSAQVGELAAVVLEDNAGESTVHVRYLISGTRAWVARGRVARPALEATPSEVTGVEDSACRALTSSAAPDTEGMTAPAPTATAYITLPTGCSLPERGALPTDAIVVLARSEFWNSQYRAAGPDLTSHIVAWGLPTVALCRATVVATEGTETYQGRRDGKTYTKSSGRPDIAGRDDARFGYVTDADCESCKAAFAETTRETLPTSIRHPMIAQRRADREHARAAKAAAAQLAQAPADDPHSAGRGRVEMHRGDVLTVSLVAGVEVSLAWRATDDAFRPDVDDDGAFRVTVLKDSQLVERARQFHDEETARQHARGMVLSYMTTGEQLATTLDTSRRVAAAATVEPVTTSTALEPAGCSTPGRPLDLVALGAGDVEPGALGDLVHLHDHDVTLWNTSGGKDSMALGVALVALARAQGYPLERIVAVHCDLGRVEWAGTAELAEEHARALGVTFYRVAKDVDLLDQVRARFVSLQRKAGELSAAAAAALDAGDVERAGELHAQAVKKAAAPAWPSSAARWCTSDQKTTQVEKLMTALAKLWREAGNTRPIRILNTLGIRAAESPARALKAPLGPDSATNTRRTVTRWLPIFGWSDAQVWAAIRASGLRVHGAYLIGMSRLSCGLCVLSSRADLVTAARANRALVDDYAQVEDEVGTTFQHRTSVREIGAAADELGPLELPAPRALGDVAGDQVDEPAPADVEPAPGDLEAAQAVDAHRGELLATFGATPDLFGTLVAAPRHTLALGPAQPAQVTAAAPPAPELHTDALFPLPRSRGAPRGLTAR